MNEATDDTSVTPTADLSITKTDGQTEAVPGEALTYDDRGVERRPVGGDRSRRRRHDAGDSHWCELDVPAAAGGANCDDVAGSGDIATTVDLPSGGSVTFTVTATLDAAATGVLSNTATLTPPAGSGGCDDGGSFGDRCRHDHAGGGSDDQQDARGNRFGSG